MIEEPSLQTLIDIANHPTLSQRLTEVIIDLHGYRTGGLGFDAEPSRSLYVAGYAPRDLLIATGQARDMLVEAFSKLPSLETIGLRDYDANGRVRDGERARWRSYGATFAGDNGVTLVNPDQEFPLLLQALGLAGAKPKSIEVFLRRNHISLNSFNVLSNRMAPVVIPVLSNLRTLMLSITSETLYGTSPENPT